MMNDRGSMWRKWDLHVHTPFSTLHNGFGNPDDDAVWKQYIHELFTKAINGGIYAIGITDYFLVDGYERILNLLQNDSYLLEVFQKEIVSDPDYLSKIKSIVLFPNIEFRLQVAVDGSKIQYHVLFSNELPPSTIKNHFLSSLRFEFNGRQYQFNRDSFIECGRDGRQTGIAIGSNSSPLFVGMNIASAKIEDIVFALNADECFRGRHLVVATAEDSSKMSWGGQTGSIRQLIFKKADAVFDANKSDIKWFSSSECHDTIGHILPCVWGSDAHDYNKLLVPDQSRYLWIKADVTFKGLCDALQSSDERIFIGGEPEELVNLRNKQSMILDSVTIRGKTADSKKTWINDTIKLNPYLVSIIGNKGSGKSALTDIIASICNSSKANHYSFLSKERFLTPKNPLRDQYEGNVLLANGNVVSKPTISNSFNQDAIEHVSYLPQRFIETTVNDIDAESFKTELEKVLFAHIPSVEKGDYTDLDSLIASISAPFDETCKNLRIELSVVNQQIEQIEKKLLPNYMAGLLQKKAELQAQLSDLVALENSSIEPRHGSEDTPEIAVIRELKAIRTGVYDYYKKDYARFNELRVQKARVEKLSSRMEEVKASVTAFNADSKSMSEEFGLGFVYELKLVYVRRDEMNGFADDVDKESESLLLKLVKADKIPEIPADSLADIDELKTLVNGQITYDGKIAIIDQAIKTITASINEEQANYQTYLLKKEERQAKIAKIQNGDPMNLSSPSLASVESEIQNVSIKYPSLLDDLRVERNNLIEKIAEEIFRKAEKMKTIYHAVQDKLDLILGENPDHISFDVALKGSPKETYEWFDNQINHRISSTFTNPSWIKSVFSDDHFGTPKTVLSMCNDILQALSEDLPALYEKGLLRNLHPSAIYDYVSSLEYMNPIFSLTMNGKSLSELSPGEKGIVLLVFYLALDLDERPLVIDQPEDNLDNESIFTRLVPLIKKAKRRRQLIVVTHNPNIAVACDSEQVICAHMDAMTNVITYQSGAIENPKITKMILNVLEGTKPAFDFRGSKYAEQR